MPAEIRLYFEGSPLLRPGFDAFFREVKSRAREKRCLFRPVAAEGTPVQDFIAGLKTNPDAWNVLLMDSEGPLAPNAAADLCAKYGLDQSHADSIFWMVETMESWFHADKDALEVFYAQGFQRNALVRNPEVERIPKKDLLDGLKAATRNTAKGAYHKTGHAPQLLAKIDPVLVRKAAPNCRKLFDAMLAQS